MGSTQNPLQFLGFPWRPNDASVAPTAGAPATAAPTSAALESGQFQEEDAHGFYQSRKGGRTPTDGGAVDDPDAPARKCDRPVNLPVESPPAPAMEAPAIDVTPLASPVTEAPSSRRNLKDNELRDIYRYGTLGTALVDTSTT